MLSNITVQPQIGANVGEKNGSVCWQPQSALVGTEVHHAKGAIDAIHDNMVKNSIKLFKG